MGFDERVAGHSTVGMKLTFRAVTVAWLDSAPEVFNTKSRLARLFTMFSFRGAAIVWPRRLSLSNFFGLHTYSPFPAFAEGEAVSNGVHWQTAAKGPGAIEIPECRP